MAGPTDDRQHGRMQRALLGSLLAATLSSVVLAWRGRVETGSAAAPLNAVSHWVHGDEALRQDGCSVRHALVGTAVHGLSTLPWAALHEACCGRRAARTVAEALAGGAAVAPVSAVVDLAVMPRRLRLTGVAAAQHGILSWALTACAVAVAAWAVRDGLAATHWRRARRTASAAGTA